jgi:CRP-like cAMP-binding protein
MNAHQYRAVIAQFIPISSLSSKHFEILLNKAEIIELAKNRPLFQRGEVDKSHFYLLEGELTIESGSGEVTKIESGTEAAMHPLAQHQPRQCTAKATMPTVCLKIESKSLDMMLSWDNASNYVVEEVTPESPRNPVDWMGNILKNPVFQKIHPSNLQAFFMKLERRNFRAGEVVITQGTAGDYFYIVGSGTVAITHTSKAYPEGMQLAMLQCGDFFGMDALVSDHPRSATATMKTDGSLMALSKEDFISLITKPLINWISYEEAAELVTSSKAILLDVRLPVEHKYANIRNSVNFPLLYLRLKQNLLDRDKLYITYCDTGGRSAASALLLQNYGFETRVLKGGMQAIQDNPDKTSSNKEAPVVA